MKEFLNWEWVTILIWVVPNLIRPDAEIECSSLLVAGDLKCTPRSMHEQVAEGHPSRPLKRSNIEAARRRRSLRTHCSERELPDDSAGASEMAADS